MNLKNKVMHALKWSAAAKLIGQILSWGMTILIIRMLTPEDYGLMAIALLFINFLIMFSEMGLGAAIVQRKELTEDILRKIFAVLLVANALLCVMLYVGAYPIAWFFEDERLVLMIQVLSLQFIIGVFSLTPMAIMERELDLKRKSIAQLAGQISGGVTALVCALNGFGVWALVWGAMADTIVRTIAMNIARPLFIFPDFSMRGMREILSFGGVVTGERVVWFAYNQADIFIIGKLLDKASLGIYSVAMHLSSLIMHKSGEILYTVAFPAFAKVQDDLPAVKHYFLKALRLMSMVVFPVFIGMSALSTEIITLLLGEKWLSAIPIFAILCLIMPLRMISNIFAPLLQGIGRPGASVKNLIVAVIVMPIAFIVGSQWGISGVGYAWVVAFPLVLLVMAYQSIGYANISILEFCKEMIGPCLIGGLMYAGIVYLENTLYSDFNSMIRLIFGVMTGATIYFVLAYLFLRSELIEIYTLVRPKK